MIDRNFLLFFLYLPISLGTVIFLTGVVLLYLNSRKQKRNLQDEHHDWEETGGKVLDSRMEEIEKVGTDTDQMAGALLLVVEYIYSVDGNEHQGIHRFSGDSKSLSKGEANDLLRKYPVNSYVPVLYDPNEPSSSSLEEQPKASNRLRMFGLLFTWFGLTVCCFTSLMFFIMSLNFI